MDEVTSRMDSVSEAPKADPNTHMLSAARVLSGLRLEVLWGVQLIRTALTDIDRTKTPCTFQVLRYMDKSLEESVQALNAMCHDADIELVEDLPFSKFFLLDLADIIDTAEIRIEKCMFGPFKLDDLPAGNPGEKEFERLLKPKIALNRSYSACMHAFATLHTAMFSDTYKLGLSEPEYVHAWRKARKKRLEEIAADIDVKLAENEKYTASLNAAKEAIRIKLVDNDQMNFDQEIDPDTAPQTGD